MAAPNLHIQRPGPKVKALSKAHTLLARQIWLNPLFLPGALPATPSDSTAPLGWPQSRQLGLGMCRECLEEESRWGGGSRCKIMGPPGEAQEAGAAIEGVRLSLYAQFWWAQSRRGIPVGSLVTLAHAQRSSRCLGSSTEPSPSPGSQQPLGCPDNQHFHPCSFVWSQSSFCGQAIIGGMEKGALP